MYKALSAIIATFLFSSLAIAQVDLLPERFVFEPELSYASDIHSPAEYLGYELGESFTLYANAVSYFQYLAEQSDRVMINEYGETYEGRKLYNLVISHPDNLAKIEDLKAANLRLGDPRNISTSDAQEIIDTKPVFVSYSYNIHGNEASGTEAALQVSYRYAAAQDAATLDVLRDAVMIFYICINPDGRDRYVYWYEGMKRAMPASSPRDLDHYAPWPNGRTNHYWFDLNRDWIWGVHPESRGHTGEYIKWMPQVHTDYHEQGYNANYFTVPGTTPRNLLLPDAYEQLADTIGKANIAAFDQHRVNYFTREAFDFFYPGYGSSYPSVMNAIGMLTEQGGISGGRIIQTDDGQDLTLRQRIFDHYTTSVATIEKAAEQKELFNRYYYEASNPKNSKSKTKAYILPDDGNIYLSEVINILLRQGIEVQKVKNSKAISGATDYRSGQRMSLSAKSGDYIISTDQPKHLFINSVLSKQMTIEDSVMYDMATWSAPIAYNLSAYSTESSLSIDTEPVTEPISLSGQVVNSGAQYAYIIDWKQRYAPRALVKLWEKGYRVRAAEEAFSLSGQRFSPGSLIVLLGRNWEHQKTWHEDMAEIADATAVTIVGLETGRMDAGNDLASRKSHPLKPVKAAMLVEQPFSTYTCGQIYYLFDQETQLPVDRVRTSMLEQTAIPKLGSRYGYADLKDYDVLILPGGGRHLSKLFGEEQLKALEQWLREGGTLVATESASSFFTDGKVPFAKAKTIKTPKDSSEQVKYLNYAERTDYFGKKRIPGSALHAEVDVTHPLAFGVEESLYSLSFKGAVLEPAAGLESVVHYAKDPQQLLASGYSNEENLELLAGKSPAAVERVGSGQIVHLVDNTQYRMFWRGPSRMMQNAVMLIPSF